MQIIADRIKAKCHYCHQICADQCDNYLPDALWLKREVHKIKSDFVHLNPSKKRFVGFGLFSHKKGVRIVSCFISFQGLGVPLP